MHVATTALSPSDGEFGASVLQRMSLGDIFIALVEYSSSLASARKFANPRPSDFRATELKESMLHYRVREGFRGVQHFHSSAGRAFCLYIVAGSSMAALERTPEIEAVLGSIEVTPQQAALEATLRR